MFFFVKYSKEYLIIQRSKIIQDPNDKRLSKRYLMIPAPCHMADRDTAYMANSSDARFLTLS